jgi:hypothetical protein
MAGQRIAPRQVRAPPAKPAHVTLSPPKAANLILDQLCEFGSTAVASRKNPPGIFQSVQPAGKFFSVLWQTIGPRQPNHACD